MQKISSTEFRKTYGSLTEPVEVTALGRVIGTYWPQGSDQVYGRVEVVERPVVKVPQAERDRILRRINKSS